MTDDLAAVVMAGGLGTRMKSATPKHLHPLLGRRMVDWVVRAARDAGVERVVVVASPETAGSFDGVEVALQREPLGTGDAVVPPAIANVFRELVTDIGDHLRPGRSPVGRLGERAVEVEDDRAQVAQWGVGQTPTAARMSGTGAWSVLSSSTWL